MQLRNGSLERVREAFEGVDLGDPRRNKRLDVSLQKLARRPGASLPKAMGTEADLEGIYRLVNNQAIAPQQLNEAFARTTASRATAAGSVLVIHDTTPCAFPHTDPDEVGYLSTGKAGFYAHISLVIDANVWRRPLGVAYVETISRKRHSKRGRRNKASGAETARWKNKESSRWERGARATAALLAGCEHVCHIADREGDSYAFLASRVAANDAFVVRVNHDRKVGDPDDLAQQWVPLKQHVKGLEGTLEREVVLSKRKTGSAPRASKTHGARKSRIATLKFTATSVVLKRPRYLGDRIAKELTLNVVHVIEPNPPKGQERVEWLLFTTLPVASQAQIETVVDNYRARWRIEEFFKALKTGCAYERRQLESAKSLLNALAILAPVAWRLLLIRHLARSPDDDRMALTPTQLEVLRAVAKRPLPAKLTARDAMLAVAALGGHIKNNGDPGWIVLGRGLHDLLIMEMAWRARGDAEK